MGWWASTAGTALLPRHMHRARFMRGVLIITVMMDVMVRSINAQGVQALVLQPGADTDIQGISSIPRHLLQKCTNGNKACSGACVDIKSDPANCGNCGAVCEPGQVCSQGKCQCPTPKDTLCLSTCVNTKTDNSNCGACGAMCTAGSSCQSGHCACLSGGQLNTTANCGSCGYVCPSGQTCSNGVCCVHCGGSSACIDLLTDVANCGTCGAACPTPSSLPNVTSVACSNGTCIISKCAAGYADCNKVLSDGCETYTDGDVANCGECGRNVTQLPNVVNPGCSAGTPTFTGCCPRWYNCDGDPKNGCEAGPVADGAIGDFRCVAGGLVVLCYESDYTVDCDQNVLNGCEYPRDGGESEINGGFVCPEGNVACFTTPYGYGWYTCDGNAASGCIRLPFSTTAVRCQNGSLAGVACDRGYYNCDGNPANGCEVRPNFATAAQCQNGSLAVTACAAGHYDCDGNGANGCEAYANHATASQCQNGRLVVSACAAGWYNCDGDGNNGCEAGGADPKSVVHGTLQCQGGRLRVACDAGYYDCDGDFGNGCEVGPAANVTHGVVQCSSEEENPYDRRLKVYSCDSGYLDCDGVAYNGCETSIPAIDYHGTYTCQGRGLITTACDAGYYDCDGKAINGCEATGTPVQDGTLRCPGTSPACNPGFYDCDGDSRNGCEAALGSDVTHGTTLCPSGKLACDAGWVDCDGNPSNGCETPLGQCVKKFTTDGGLTYSWAPPAGFFQLAELLVVAGGGGGGGGLGGGGGAGGLVYRTNYPVQPGVSYAITVGQGGAGGRYTDSDGANGGDSSFGSDPALVAVGGGAGMRVGGSYTSSGGSGGGCGLIYDSSSDTWVPAGVSTARDGQGFLGGNSSGYSVNGGGGGGAGWAGGDAMSCAGAGGPGLKYTFSGVTTLFANGGGGAGNCVGAGAPDGSGAGSWIYSFYDGHAGAPDTGGGGGGAGYGVGGAGGSGAAVLRY